MCHHDWFLKALFKENAHCKMTGAPYYLHIFKTESYVIYMNTIHKKSVRTRIGGQWLSLKWKKGN